jgi:hypothetical protein
MATSSAKKSNKSSQGVKGSKLAKPTMKLSGGRMTNSLNAQTRDAKTEQGFQMQIERMQVQNLSKRFSSDRITAAAEKELERIIKNETTAKGLKDFNGFVSDYSTLKEIYHRDLEHITEEFVANDANNQKKRFIARHKGEVTHEQELVIEEFYAGKAAQTFGVVNRVQRLLVHKGALKDATVAKEIDKQIEALEKEAQERNTVNAPTATV